MSTKLNAEELAAQYIPDWSENDFTTKRRGFAMCVEKFAQPIADERDEYREWLEYTCNLLNRLPRLSDADRIDAPGEAASVLKSARAILAKYPNP